MAIAQRALVDPLPQLPEVGNAEQDFQHRQGRNRRAQCYPGRSENLPKPSPLGDIPNRFTRARRAQVRRLEAYQIRPDRNAVAFAVVRQPGKTGRARVLANTPQNYPTAAESQAYSRHL